MKIVASIVPQPKPHKSRAKRPTYISSFFGSQDGIRWGTLVVLGLQRTFLHDRLAGRVRIHRQVGTADHRVEDLDPSRCALALALLDARWAEELEAAQ